MIQVDVFDVIPEPLTNRWKLKFTALESLGNLFKDKCVICLFFIVLLQCEGGTRPLDKAFVTSFGWEGL